MYAWNQLGIERKPGYEHLLIGPALAARHYRAKLIGEALKEQ
jgi:hypothetical protein